MTTFTKEQIMHFNNFEEVRSEGQFNMFSRDAREAAGLSSFDYTFVMKNYPALKKAAEEFNHGS